MPVVSLWMGVRGDLVKLLLELRLHLFELLRRGSLGRLRSIDADRIDRSVHSDPSGEPTNRLDRIFFIIINRNGALRLGHFQPRRDRIDGENKAGIHELGAGNYELSDRAAAENGDGFSRFDLRQPSAEVAG